MRYKPTQVGFRLTHLKHVMEFWTAIDMYHWNFHLENMKSSIMLYLHLRFCDT